MAEGHAEPGECMAGSSNRPEGKKRSRKESRPRRAGRVCLRGLRQPAGLVLEDVRRRLERVGLSPETCYQASEEASLTRTLTQDATGQTTAFKDKTRKRSQI